jgi:hypothetical protein
LSRFPFVPALILLMVLHCGGGADSSNFNVEPEPRTITVGDRLPLAAHPNAELNTDVAWEVEEPYGGGLRNSEGNSTVYFAPEAAGTYHLTLRADRADGRKLKQTVAIQVLPMPAIAPAFAQVAQGGSVTFTATMKGLARNTVKWSTDGGEISDEGRYQPPAKAGSYTVTATSTLDSTVSASAKVDVGD